MKTRCRPRSWAMTFRCTSASASVPRRAIAPPCWKHSVAREPAIAELFDAGVDVRLGTSVWGLYANGPSVGWLPGPVAGLHDNDGNCFMLGCERVIVAAGRRDMGLAFPGWELPGVLGITAAQRLSERFGILDARRVVVLGTSAEALVAARSLRNAGVEIAALVEVAPAPIGPTSLLRELADIPVLCGHSVRRAIGGSDGVQAIVVTPAASHGPELSIDCDAVLLGVGTVPVIELLDALGCRMGYVAERGGHVPVLDATQRTSLSWLYAAGDCAGIWPAKTLDADIARAEGRRAAAAVARFTRHWPADHLSRLAARYARARHGRLPARLGARDCRGRRRRTFRLPVRGGHCARDHGASPTALSRAGRTIGATRARSVRCWATRRPIPDQVKRLTRAGMGLCQGRRCREQVAALLALASGARLRDIPLASHRAPVRPLPLSVVAETQEHAEMTRHWDTWFGMPSQYVPLLGCAALLHCLPDDRPTTNRRTANE